jgi:mannosylglycerate hydrolase
VTERKIFLVSHFHWDREWYRTFEDFRSHLVDAIDAVLELAEADDGFRFMLDGQTIVLDDYLEIRPERRAALERGIRRGQLGAGPWYVQPDSFLPGGETHLRNLLFGRATALSFGACSSVAYVPDSFGHPAQFPQLFAGFGLEPFVYWRGNTAAADAVTPFYRWRAPDGSELPAWYLAEGYFGAGALDADGDASTTADRLAPVIERLAAAGGPVLLMNGFDHLPPDATTAAVASKVGAERALLDEAVRASRPADGLAVYAGALDGARNTNLLPGVWSARMRLKLRNRQCETLLTHWVEPWVAFARHFGLNDERPALDHAWRTLLQNQAHDSIGGCSIDPVHDRMHARYDDVDGLGRATVTRVLERLSGRDRTRRTPWSREQDVAVFNASGRPVTAVARIPLDGFPPWQLSVGRFDFHPFLMPDFAGVTIDGRSARLVPSDDPTRVRFLPGAGGLDVEFVASDVPAFGCKRFRLEPGDAAPDEVDDGRTIEMGDIVVRANDNGTFDVTLSGREYRYLFGIEECVDVGDSYDADPESPRDLVARTSITRTRHASGIARLRVVRDIDAIGALTVDALLAPGVPFVRCDVTLDNRAENHRVRLRFPTGAPVDAFDADTTFDTARRTTAAPDDSTWVHRAPRTFAHHGRISANGLTIGAPGLPEAEVTPGGDVLVTLVRSIGMLAELELRTRPVPAGPAMAAPGAQELGTVHATITLATNPRDAAASEVGVWGVLGDADPTLTAGTSLLSIDAAHSELSACKPAEDGDGLIVRVLNPSDQPDDVALRFGIPLQSAHGVRLDESFDDSSDWRRDGDVVSTKVPPHALRTVRVQLFVQ